MMKNDDVVPIAPVAAVPAGMVTATAVPIPINHGARTAMLQPSAPFPPAKPNKREVGGGCGCCEMVGGGGCNMVDCQCAGPREYAMIEGQRFYLSICLLYTSPSPRD